MHHVAGAVNGYLQMNDHNLVKIPYNIPTETSFHWYNNLLGVYMGGTLGHAVGVVGSPGSTAVDDFYGTGGQTLNGFTNEGIYLIAEATRIPGVPLPGGGFSPEDVSFDEQDYSEENIFSSNSGKYEFPVFSEKYMKSPFVDTDTTLITDEEIPFTSDVAGCFSKLLRDLYPWFSPANYKVSEIFDVEKQRYIPSNTEIDELYNSKINFIRSTDGFHRLSSDKSYSSSSSDVFSKINITSLFIYIKKNVQSSYINLIFEHNDNNTRTTFINSITPFLENIQGNRGITEFKVICDESNNTPDIIDSNQFVADLYIKPTKTIDFIKLRFTNSSDNSNLF